MIKPIRLANQLLLVGLACNLSAAWAQEVGSAGRLDRVEVTGSSIKRIQDEGALPVQVLKAADLANRGVTTAEQLLQQLTANGNGIDNLATNQGGDFTAATSGAKPHNNGASSASLRGLGAQYTLVLLNGQRIATHGLNGQSVDLNGIPLAALERVEILKDGASAVYGADAIGGVINFILKRDYQGLEATVSADKTQRGGGDIFRASVLFGAGNLSVDRFNVMAALTYDETERLRGTERGFQNGIQPERGLFPDTTGAPYANIGVADGTAVSSTDGTTLAGFSRVSYLALTGTCSTVPDMYAYRGDVTGTNAFNKACAYDYGKRWSLMQPLKNSNFVGRGTLALDTDTTAFVEAVASQSKSMVEYTEIQLTSSDYQYPAGGPYFQNLAKLLPDYFRLPGTVNDGRVVFDPSKPERIRWRCLPCGPRQQLTTTNASRVLAGVNGLLSGWDYQFDLSAAQSGANTAYGDGNMLTNRLAAAMATGRINPFLLPGESQTAEALQLISDSSARGRHLYGGKATVSQFDGVMSKEAIDFFGRRAAAALGFVQRRETYRYTNGQDQINEPVDGVTAVPSLDRVARDIKAMYGELQMPLVNSVQAQLAVRYDRYSDFGGTLNPKVALRWQPTQTFLLRSAYSRGFHAPDFDPLYGGESSGQFNSDINDPVLCPTGREASGCGIRPLITTRSNPHLKPEKSKQLSLGVVASPTGWLTASVDYWNIRIDNRISALSGLALINNYERYKQYVLRDPVTQEISEVVAPFFNLAGDKTDGVDINVSASIQSQVGRFATSFDATYIRSYKSRFSPNDPWVERVNDFGGADFGYDLKLRWKHNLTLAWFAGPWTTNLQQIYNSGYHGEVGGFVGFTPPQLPSRVSSYTLYNMTISYAGIKNLNLTAGIKNLFDTKPPFSGHNVDNVAGAGWDARVGDPRLRSFLLRASYKFQ